MSKPTLHALLTGINAYQPPVTALRGCLHDVETWEKYLRRESENFTLRFSILKDEQVTRQALFDALKRLLSDANAGDVVFFFYSGHGTREIADPVFYDLEPDRALESIVCYDSISYRRGEFQYMLFSDKELHYLISKYGRDDVHVLTIFDCCHSGGMTRNMFLGERDGVTMERRHVPVERLSSGAPMRRWEHFLFGNDVRRADVEKNGWLNTVPQKRHLTLSACQNDESAFERDGKGIFTSNLIEILTRTGGAISYYDLQTHARLLIQNQFRQTPEIYAVHKHEQDVLRTFLNKPPRKQLGFGCACSFQKEKGWCIDLGAIHGVSLFSGPVEVNSGEKTLEVAIDSVEGSLSILNDQGMLKRKLKEDQVYPAYLKAYINTATTFWIDTTSFGGAGEDVSKSIRQGIGKTSSLVESRSNATYVISKQEDVVRICINDDALRPVTELQKNDPDFVAGLYRCMRHIAQWEYIRSLSNPGFSLKEFPVSVEIFRIDKAGQERPVALRGDVLEMEYDTGSAMPKAYLSVRLRNQGAVKYFCAMLYLSNDFQVYTGMLDGKVVGVNPGEEVWLYKGDKIPLDLEKHIIDFNFAYSTFYLKLLANPSFFQVNAMEQSALPPPVKGNTRSLTDPSRGIVTREEQAISDATWFTRTICIKMKNPFYQE